MHELLIVDGYNIIFAWPELRELPLAHARDRLHGYLMDYCGFCGFELLLIFDAHHQPLPKHSEQDGTIVFTGAAETADMYIERIVRQNEGLSMRVATSDSLEQVMILGFAQRMSARELIEDIKRVQQKYRATYIDPITGKNRNALEKHLSPEHFKRLEDLRRGKE